MLSVSILYYFQVLYKTQVSPRCSFPSSFVFLTFFHQNLCLRAELPSELCLRAELPSELCLRAELPLELCLRAELPSELCLRAELTQIGD
nr:hypothetical protein BgiMline_033485 [Biomphalaria glabrata]